MPAIFDLLYREYCRARLAEMRKQLLLRTESDEVPGANCFERYLTAIGMVAQKISAKPSAASQAPSQITSGLSTTHELLEPFRPKFSVPARVS